MVITVSVIPLFQFNSKFLPILPCTELETTREERRGTIEVLKKRFLQLWDRLTLDEGEKQTILQENNTCQLSVVENLKTQVCTSM